MKYSKITQKCTKLQHRATGIVRQQYKKFGGQNKKKFVCRVSDADTRHITAFAECRKVTLGIDVGLPSVVF